MKRISILLLAATAILIGLAACTSCKKPGKTPKPGGNKEQEFKTTYRIALSDGRVFEGVSTKTTGQLIALEENGGDPFSLIVATGLDGREKNQLSATLLFDKDNNLLPFHTERSGTTSLIALTFADENVLLGSVSGSHTISNLVLHPWIATPTSGSHKITFRYEFNDVVLRNALGGAEDITANGYILCVPD